MAYPASETQIHVEGEDMHLTTITSILAVGSAITLGGCSQLREQVARARGQERSPTTSAHEASIPDHPQGFLGVDISDRIYDSQRKYTSFSDVVYVDPATLEVYFSDGRVVDAAGIVREPDGEYRRNNLGRYVNLARESRTRAKKSYPDASWADLRTARIAAEEADATRLADADRLAKDNVLNQSRQNGYEITERTFFDPSGGLLVDQHRLRPRDALVGKKFLLMPLDAIGYKVTDAGIIFDPSDMEEPSVERRVVSFDESGLLRCVDGGGEFTTSYRPVGDFGEPVLAVRLDKPIPGLGSATLGISRVNVPDPKEAIATSDSVEPGARQSSTRRDDHASRREARRARAKQPSPRIDLAEPALTLTDGRTDGSALARTRFHAFLIPLDDAEHARQAQAQLDYARTRRKAIDDRHAMGLPVETLVFPSWGAVFGGSFNGPQDQKQANDTLQAIWHGQDMNYLRHIFIAFQLVWADMHPEPTEPVATFVYTQDGYESRNGFGVVTSRQDPIRETVIVRQKFAGATQQVYPDVMVMDEIAFIRRTTLGLRPLVRYFYAHYPPGTPTAAEFERRLHDSVQRGQ